MEGVRFVIHHHQRSPSYRARATILLSVERQLRLSAQLFMMPSCYCVSPYFVRSRAINLTVALLTVRFSMFSPLGQSSLYQHCLSVAPQPRSRSGSLIWQEVNIVGELVLFMSAKLLSWLVG